MLRAILIKLLKVPQMIGEINTHGSWFFFFTYIHLIIIYRISYILKENMVFVSLVVVLDDL